jgi:hypothetical protein
VDLPSLVVGAVLGAVFGFVAERTLPQVWRFVLRPKDLRTHVELDAEPPTVRFLTDPAIFEADFPNWIGAEYMLPDGDIADFGPPPSAYCREWREWARAHNGVDARASKVQIIVEARAENTVVIDRLEVNVWNRARPIQGTLVRCLVGGAALQPRELGVRLDDERPQAAYFREAGNESGTTESFTFKLGPGDVEVFRLYAIAERHYVEWTATLHYAVDGVRKSIELDDGGEPFKTTGTSGAKRAFDSIGDGRWRPTSRRERALGHARRLRRRIAGETGAH